MSVSVKLGTAEATEVHVTDDKKLTCKIPKGTGVVAVKVITAGGEAVKDKAFTYVKAPTISHIGPHVGPLKGGQEVTVTGSNYVQGETRVFVNSREVTATVSSATSLKFTTQTATSAGPVDVTVLGVGGKATAKGGYVYAPVPTLTNVEPGKGPEDGGTLITLTGTGFNEGKPERYDDLPLIVIYEDTDDDTGPDTGEAPPVFEAQ